MEESHRLYRGCVRGMAEVIDAGVIDSGLSVKQTLVVFIVVMHGLTDLHLANDPELPVGSGRFGGLVSDILAPANLLGAQAPEGRLTSARGQ